MNTDKPNYSPEEIYNRVVADNGVTNADDLAKEFGLRTHNQILQRIGQHILSSMQRGVTLAYPKLNVPLPVTRKTRKLNVAYRTGTETKLQISAAKLKDLGGFDDVSTFEISASEINGENVLVFKPIARFNSSNPTSTTSFSTTGNSGSNAAGSGFGQGNSSSSNNSGTPTELTQAVPENTTVEISSFDDIPNTVTSSSNVPSVSEETEDEEEFNANMI